MRLADVLANLPARYLAHLAGRPDDSRAGRAALAADARARLLEPGRAREVFERLRPESRALLRAVFESPDFRGRAALEGDLSAAGWSARFIDPAVSELKRVGFAYEMARGGERGLFVPDDLVATLVRVFPDLCEKRIGEWETRVPLLPPFLGHAADRRLLNAEATAERLKARLRFIGRDAVFVGERIREIIAALFGGPDAAADLAAAKGLPGALAAPACNFPPALAAVLSGEAETLDLGVMKEPAPDAVDAALFLWNAGFLEARPFDRRLPVVVRLPRPPLEAAASPFAADPALPARVHVVARPPAAALLALEFAATPAPVPGVLAYDLDPKRAKAAFRAGFPPDALEPLPGPFRALALSHASKRRKKAAESDG